MITRKTIENNNGEVIKYEIGEKIVTVYTMGFEFDVNRGASLILKSQTSMPLEHCRQIAKMLGE